MTALWSISKINSAASCPEGLDADKNMGQCGGFPIGFAICNLCRYEGPRTVVPSSSVISLVAQNRVLLTFSGKKPPDSTFGLEIVKYLGGFSAINFNFPPAPLKSLDIREERGGWEGCNRV